MRTARAVIPILNGTRPNSAACLVEAAQALTRLADGAQAMTPVKFAGYNTAADLNLGTTLSDMPAGMRFAVYEADFADVPQPHRCGTCGDVVEDFTADSHDLVPCSCDALVQQ